MTGLISRTLFLVGVAAATVTACATSTPPSANPVSASPPVVESSQPVIAVPADFPFGSWTTTITMEDLEAAGPPEVAQAENVGVFTLSMTEDGAWETTQVSDVDLRWPIFRGTWVATGPDSFRQETTFPPDFAGDVVDFTWNLEGGALVLKVVNPPDPVLPIVIETYPWQPAG